MKSNKHGIGMNGILGAALGFIGLVVFFQIIAALYPTASTAGQAIQTSGMPLGSLFGSSGVFWYLVAAGVLVAGIAYVKLKKK